jgi:putative DNA primase/helicase
MNTIAPSNTIERARGRWKEILPRLGIEHRFLVNRHGPCPICGGKDRFRFDDKHGEGTYFCNQCRAGTGIILLRKLKGWTHAEACCAVDEIIGTDWRPFRPVVRERPAASEATRRRAIERLLAEAEAPEVVERYLLQRGLPVGSPVLQGHPRCPYFDGEGRLLGRYPAVLAPIVDPAGALVSVQRVYLADVPERKKTMAPVGTIKGGAVRLQAATDALGVCEGFETGLAAHALFGVPVWAALSAGNLEAFEPPPGITRLHVFADNDESGEGQAAAFNLARRVNRANRQRGAEGLPVQVHLPPSVGADWLDVLAERRPA